MTTPPQSGKPGHNPTIAIIAVVVFAAHVDKAWLTVFLSVIVTYGLISD